MRYAYSFSILLCLRISLVSLISLPLGLGMLGVGGLSLASCSAQNVSQLEIATVEKDNSQTDFTVVSSSFSMIFIQSISFTAK